MVGVPLTLFVPFIARVSTKIPMAFWAGVYVLLQFFIDRGLTTTSDEELAVIVLEIVLLAPGIWLAHQLALQINHAESVMDDLAVDAFPHRAQELDESSQRVKIEFTRSRRYHRPLAMLLLEVDPETHIQDGVRNIQYDIMNRFTAARIGQIIDERLRQTDLVLRDRRWAYVILCPETDYASILLLAKRMTQAIKEKTGLSILWGVAAFPEEALTFDDLLKKARQRLTLGEMFDPALREQMADKGVEV
jgi:GGDEF domain-containing protein